MFAQNALLSFFLIIGGVFGFLAALIAFFITYLEYRKHRFTGWALWREPLIRSVFTFLFFFGLCFLLAYALS